jgi:hypothetical protein
MISGLAGNNCSTGGRPSAPASSINSLSHVLF